MRILNTENLYVGKFTKADFIEESCIEGRSGTTRIQRCRALNCELEVLDDSGEPICTLPWGIKTIQVATHNCRLIRFFKSIGVYFDPSEFNPKTDLKGCKVLISVKTVCDNYWGLRTVVDQFFPAPLTTAEEAP